MPLTLRRTAAARQGPARVPACASLGSLSQPPRRIQTRLVDGAAAAGLAAIVALVAFILLNRPLKDDVAWLLYLGERMLEGRQLYVDLVEINPPLIVWLSALPAGAAHALGLPVIPVFLAATAMALLGCAWLTASLLRGYAALFRRRLRVFAVIAGVLFAMPGHEFGQREHLLVAFVLPYLAVLALRLQARGAEPPPRAAAAIGLLAGIGIALKPFHLVSFVLLEALALRRGLGPPWRRAEAIGVIAFVVCYGLSIGWCYPAYFAEVVPLVCALYGASAAGLASLLGHGLYLLVPLAVVAPLLLSGVGRPSREPLSWVLVVFAAGALLAYLAQDKGWFYHRLPGEIALVLLLVYWVVQTVCGDGDGAGAGERAGRSVWLSFAVLAGLLGAFGAAALDRLGWGIAAAVHPEASIEHRLAEVIRRDRARSLLVLSQDLSPAFPVVNVTGVQWTSRFAAMWPLRAELRRSGGCADAAAPAEQSRLACRWIVDDFLARRPDIVVVDDRHRLDYIGALAADPRFAAAWSDYRLRGTLDGRRIFGPAS
jgi:hypothetical protein